MNCRRKVTNTGSRARITRLHVNPASTPVLFVENGRCGFKLIPSSYLRYLADPESFNGPAP